MSLTRRMLLHTAAAYGFLSARAGLSFGKANTQKRLVVIMLRGGMDSLDVFRPVGDRDFAALRPDASTDSSENAVFLDPFFNMHKALQTLVPMFKDRELAVVHAVSTPYRSRSHFEAQDLLEWGAQADERHESGWVNRLIGLLGGEKLGFATEVGTSISQLMIGPKNVLNIYPETELGFWSNSGQFLEMLYKDESGFEQILAHVREITARNNPADNVDPGVSVREIAALASRRLRQDCRLATFSLYGWDTHIGQNKRMAKNLEPLATALTTLKSELAETWRDTLVMAVSEFGRTARYNGSQGTDHGTGGAALIAGGALANGAGGKVLTSRWPGLSDDQLFEGRDLMPTDDIRRYIGWGLAQHFDLSPGQIEKSLFPGVDMSSKLRII